MHIFEDKFSKSVFFAFVVASQISINLCSVAKGEDLASELLKGMNLLLCAFSGVEQ